MAGHRATLKRSNKGFKSGHASKRALKAASKGKVEKSKSNNKALKVQSKLERKNLAAQLRKGKIDKTQQDKHLFTNTNVERIVVVLPLTKNISALNIINQIFGSLDDEQLSIEQDVSVTSIRVRRYKANLKVIIPDMSNFIAILDAAKVADFVIFGLSATEEVDPTYGEQILRAVETQGISSAFGVISDLVSSYPKRNLQQDVLKSLTSFFNHFFPNNEKLFALENQMESLNLLRTICQKIPKSISWRDNRGYVVADGIRWEASPSSPVEGTLVVEGVARGIGFHPDRLIHLQGLGDFHVSRLEKMSARTQIEDENVYVPGVNQESLDELLQEDGRDDGDIELDDEEEWSESDDELDEQIATQAKRLPKGISEYQAKWLHDQEIEDLIEERGLASDDEEAGNGSDSDVMDYDDEGAAVSASQSVYAPSEMHVELSNEEEAKQLEAFKMREREEIEFPDELELHPDELATKRLERYRGVKSLANCEWDCDEYDDKRPSNWHRYLRVRNFKATKNKIAKDCRKETVIKPGDRCRIFVNVPFYVFERIQDPTRVPFVLYSLLHHEHKLAVCNFTVQTWENYEKPIKSKELMIVQYGPRRVMIQPLFSQASNNANNTAKFQRFLHQGLLSIATAVAPVSFTNSPALFFKMGENGSIELMGQGSFLNADHSRVMAKRIVLTGEIFKIHKSVVTVRYMFFNSHDVNHYKNIPIYTKMGRSGMIKESLGTHGYFKATFDGKLNAQDVVAMPLYKRVWPRESNGYGVV